jgi:hypothetical protein
MALPVADHSAAERPSLIARLNTPTKWRRSTGLKVWAGLGLLLALLLGRLVFSRATAPSIGGVPISPSGAPAMLLAARSSPPSVETGQPPSPKQDESQAAATPEAPANEDTSSIVADRSLGWLTVHSAEVRASVFLMFKRYGAVEEKLAVPCGKRFVGIGLPAPAKREPTWLAPGKTIEVPCGGAIELTINPRMLR